MNLGLKIGGRGGRAPRAPLDPHLYLFIKFNL